jgi:hypothetical protein
VIIDYSEEHHFYGLPILEYPGLFKVIEVAERHAVGRQAGKQTHRHTDTQILNKQDRAV